MARRPPNLLRPALLGAVALLVGVAGCSSHHDAPIRLSAAGRRGMQVAQDQRCSSCHTTDGTRAVGPSWKDLAGSTVTLSSGAHVVADDAYLERSIRNPRVQAVKGYINFMPEVYRDLSRRQVADLIAYLHDLSSADGSPVRR